MAVPNDLGPFFYAWVATRSDLAALVGTRVTPWKRPQEGALPAITYQQVGAFGVSHLAGLSGLEADMYQLDCWATTYKQARAIAALVRGRKGDPRLDRYVGELAGFTIRECKCTDQRDSPENPQDAGDIGFPAVQLDWKIWWDFVT